MAMGVMKSARPKGRRGRSSRRAPMAEINVTPFVDVMLVLLIIFMVTAPLMSSAVPIHLPDSRAKPMAQTPDQITISIDDGGFIYINGKRVPPGRFPQALEQVQTSGPKKPLVTLRADRALDYGRVMAVMGELNRAGFDSISLVTNSSVKAP